MQVYWYYIFWGFCSSLLFFLSQQIYIYLLMHAKILRDCSKAVNSSLISEIRRARLQNQVEETICSTYTRFPDHRYAASATGNITRLSLTSTCKNIKQRYMKLYLHCKALNDTFGDTLFIILMLDLLTSFGFTACIVGNTAGKVVVTLVFEIISIIIFMGYATIYAWPMVSAHEQVTFFLTGFRGFFIEFYFTSFIF